MREVSTQQLRKRGREIAGNAFNYAQKQNSEAVRRDNKYINCNFTSSRKGRHANSRHDDIKEVDFEMRQRIDRAFYLSLNRTVPGQSALLYGTAHCNIFNSESNGVVVTLDDPQYKKLSCKSCSVTKRWSPKWNNLLQRPYSK